MIMGDAFFHHLSSHWRLTGDFNEGLARAHPIHPEVSSGFHGGPCFSPFLLRGGCPISVVYSLNLRLILLFTLSSGRIISLCFLIYSGSIFLFKKLWIAGNSKRGCSGPNGIEMGSSPNPYNSLGKKISANRSLPSGAWGETSFWHIPPSVSFFHYKLSPSPSALPVSSPLPLAVGDWITSQMTLLNSGEE